MPLRGSVYIARGGALPGHAHGRHARRGSEPGRQSVAHAGVSARTRREHVGP
jgi:hypothetical protein